MAGFPDNLVERVRAASDIVEIIGASVPLKKSGGGFSGLCPFHREKSPSFTVTPHKQMYYCFGCHKGGDVFRFVQDYENVSFPEALKRLADRARIPIEMDMSGADQAKRAVRDKLLEIHEGITHRWQTALANEAGGQIARDYLLKRGVPDEAVKLFRLGYAPDLWDDTVNWARGKGYDAGLMEQSGLIIKREGGEGHYDRFRGRLMFPICDEQGRVIGFSGRILGDEKTAKYVNSPETPIFSKGRVFFGLDKSKRALLDTQTAVLCEGQLDLIRCHMAGVQNVVAPQGTAFTSEHARLLKRFASEVVCCFDADNAGQNATVKALDAILENGMTMRVALLPAPHDPDSFVKEFGAEPFREIIKKAPDFFDFLLDRLCQQNDIKTDKGQKAVVKLMAEAVHKTKDPVIIDRYARKTGLRLGVSGDMAAKSFSAAGKAAAKPEPQYAPEDDEYFPTDEESAPAVMERPSPVEYWLLKTCFLNDENLEWLEAHLDLDWLSHSGVRTLLGMRLTLTEEGRWREPASFVGEIEDEALRALGAECAFEKRSMPGPLQVVQDTVLRIRNLAIDREITRVMQELSEPGITQAEQERHFQRASVLKARKKSPLTPVHADS